MRWKKNNFHHVFLTSFCGECGELRWIIYFHRVLSILTKKNSRHTGSNLWPHAFLPLLSPLRQLSLIFKISCEFKSVWVYFGNHMRWVFVRNVVKFAVNFCKKSGEIFIFTAFTAITAFLTKIHRVHRISYKNYPKTSTRESIESRLAVWSTETIPTQILVSVKVNQVVLEKVNILLENNLLL